MNTKGDTVLITGGATRIGFALTEARNQWMNPIKILKKGERCWTNLY